MENNRIKEKYIYRELDTHNKSKESLVQEFHKLFLEKEDSFIIDIFYVQLLNIYKCTCGFENFSFEKVFDIPLKMPNIKNYNLLELIRLNFFYDNVKWELPCKNCQKKDLIIEQFIKSILNEIIFFFLQRFNRFSNSINNLEVKFEYIIDLSPFMVNLLGVNSCKFSLKGIVNCKGDFEEGHCWSVIKINGVWCEFNDLIIRKKDIIDFQNSTAVILVCEKI